MKLIKTSTILKIAMIFVLSAVVVGCATSVTLASMSAQYVWQTDTAIVGEFGYEDTHMSLDLFASDYIYPGDSGSATLDVPDFGPYDVDWTLTEQNDDVIPVVFWVSTESGTVAYSKYNFSSLGSVFVKLGDEYLSASSVSASSASLILTFADEVVLNWVWPNELYVDNGGTPFSGETKTAYENYNVGLTATSYAFGNKHIPATSPAGFGVADGANFTFSAVSSLSCNSSTGLLQYVSGDSTVDVVLNKEDDTETAISKNDYYCFAFANTSAGQAAYSAYVTACQTNGVRYEELNGLYGKMGSTLSPSESGNLKLIKVYPLVAVGEERATIGLTITATVRSLVVAD